MGAAEQRSDVDYGFVKVFTHAVGIGAITSSIGPLDTIVTKQVLKQVSPKLSTLISVDALWRPKRLQPT